MGEGTVRYMRCLCCFSCPRYALPESTVMGIPSHIPVSLPAPDTLWAKPVVYSSLAPHFGVWVLSSSCTQPSSHGLGGNPGEQRREFQGSCKLCALTQTHSSFPCLSLGRSSWPWQLNQPALGPAFLSAAPAGQSQAMTILSR